MDIKCFRCGEQYNSLYYDLHQCRNVNMLNDQGAMQAPKADANLYVGIITILMIISTFWLTEHKEYIAKMNDIKIGTEENLRLSRFILRDEKIEWLYLASLSNTIYTNNWNYIARYYGDCLDIFKATVINIDSINTLIGLRQNKDTIPQHAIDLHSFTNSLDYQLSYILNNCKIKPMSLFYKSY